MAASPNSGAAGLPPPAPGDQPDGTAPVSVTIPALGIRSPLVRLGLTPDGALGVPSDFGRAGWYTGGPPPGQPGPSVIAGHVDSRRGPAVFYRLRDLRAGDEIHVQRRDRTTVTFAVTELRQYAKTAFPTREVYGPVPQAELRLITCAGVFDAEQSSYRSNLVVFAELISLDPTAPRSR